ncbi:response regulator (plasmid) [Ensifer adhaerens]|uniref:HWE histidine kinase domain-containing protein n=1 Tax=Ensifer adhaerens TaxID=106592 RepID=UPI001CBF61F0|nr:HWE histidine kinase domain-containing protein [Ensifer adhaerens]MBZ7927688.1 response regulator [Ensifer adhaerens]UAX98083.1 response regulator [Ensifer adhaerens]UAY05464.1 response regulator [Ensifer adhaerens]UAY12842.1 response regulator [Ensifer adhaerens]
MHYLEGKDFIADTHTPDEHWLEKYIPPCDQTLVLAAVKDAIRGKAPFELEHRVVRADKSLGWAHSRVIPMLNAREEVTEWFGAARDITGRKQAEETKELLLSELSHRVKNMLASVQALAQQTLRTAPNPRAFVERFTARLQSMSRMHSLLTRTGWKGADLDDIIRDQLLPGIVDSGRISSAGPPVRFDAQTSTHMAMILHELGTNAVKHGALSTPAGHVSIGWGVSEASLRLVWEEEGGPAVGLVGNGGFGTKLVEQVARGAGGAASSSTTMGGLRWEITMPLEVNDVKGDAVAPADATRSLASRSATGLKGKRFVVIEDEALIAVEISSILEEQRAEVVGWASSVDDALRIIDENDFDGALLDANLRGRTVDEVAAALTDKNIPFVFVTGYGREALPAGFGDTRILMKPFDPLQLAEMAKLLVS